MVAVMVLVLLCAADTALALAAQGERIPNGVNAGGMEGVRLLSEDDPCGGVCEGLGRSCVVAKGGRASFCVDCTGLLRPTSSDNETFEECCNYNARRMKCGQALGGTSLGKCLRSEDLFVRATVPTPASFRRNSGNACGKPWDFRDNGLACRIIRQRNGRMKCITSDGTEEQPPRCNTSFVQVGAAIDGESRRDYSGASVAMSADGSRMAIGAANNDGNGRDAGHVRVFEMQRSEGWVQVGQDIDGESAGDISGTSVAMSADGNRVAIGAPNNDGNGIRRTSGHARVFEMQGCEGWVQVGQDIDGEYSGDFSGRAVVMSADGSRVAIGTGTNSYSGVHAGHVRVFEMQGNEGWVQVGLDIDGESAHDQSGNSIAMSADGSRVAIGARFANSDVSGHVRVFEVQGSEGWVQVGQDIDGESEGEFFGEAVAMSADGSRVVIGATTLDESRARIFHLDGSGEWVQVGQDIDGESPNEFFGAAVAISADGSRVAIGAPGHDGNGRRSGNVRLFEVQGSEGWVQVGQDIDGESEGDYTGTSVAMSADGNRVAIGATGNNGNGDNSGHVRVFEEVRQC